MLNFIKRVFGGQPKSRTYGSYEDYVNHQKEKTQDPERRKKWLNDEWDDKLTYFQTTFARVAETYPHLRQSRALGLGARTGQEVQAMKNVGMDAVGIDLVPAEPLVVEGDIHAIPFSDSSFKFAFTNIYDHSLYPDKFVSEIIRVLDNGGVALLHLCVGKNTDDYGVTYLDDTRSLHKYFKGHEILADRAMPMWGGLNWELLVRINK